MTVASYERMERHSVEEASDKHKPRVFCKSKIEKKNVLKNISCPGYVKLVLLKLPFVANMIDRKYEATFSIKRPIQTKKSL